MSSTSLPPTGQSAPCPSCGVPASGRFCANCGAPLEGARCAACAAQLSVGARFCHRCGTAVGATAPAPAARTGDAGFNNALPWAVAAIALLALIALVAGQRFSRTHGAAQAADVTAQAGAADDGGSGGGAPVRAPDISQMSPQERADRLYDLIMRFDSEGKKDSIAFFAPMALSAYQMLPQQTLDSHYDMGRIAEVAGAGEVARAEADTILAQDPHHLLGLILSISVARDAGDKATVQRDQRTLVAAEKTELAKNLPEYQRHQTEITAALAEAKRGAKP